MSASRKPFLVEAYPVLGKNLEDAEINMVSYARLGEIILQVLPDHLVIEARDKGPGVVNLRMAMEQGRTTADERIRALGFDAGMGLNNIRSYSEIVHISSEVGAGTRIKMIIHPPAEAK